MLLEQYTVPSAVKVLRHKRKINKKPQSVRSFILPTSHKMSSRRLKECSGLPPAQTYLFIRQIERNTVLKMGGDLAFVSHFKG